MDDDGDHAEVWGIEKVRVSCRSVRTSEPWTVRRGGPVRICSTTALYATLGSSTRGTLCTTTSPCRLGHCHSQAMACRKWWGSGEVAPLMALEIAMRRDHQLPPLLCTGSRPRECGLRPHGQAAHAHLRRGHSPPQSWPRASCTARALANIVANLSIQRVQWQQAVTTGMGDEQWQQAVVDRNRELPCTVGAPKLESQKLPGVSLT